MGAAMGAEEAEASRAEGVARFRVRLQVGAIDEHLAYQRRRSRWWCYIRELRQDSAGPGRHTLHGECLGRQERSFLEKAGTKVFCSHAYACHRRGFYCRGRGCDA